MRANTVLIVDDNAAMRKALCRLFKATGEFNVCGEASNGSEAIALAKTLKPDIVVLDLCMPGLNGLETAPEVRSANPASKVILYSMNADELLEADASRAGVAAVVSKADGMRTFVIKARSVVKGAPALFRS